MKKLLMAVIVILLATVSGKTQSMIGFTEQQVKDKFYYKTFYTNYTAEGDKYIWYWHEYGKMEYFIDNRTNKTDFCALLPKDSYDRNQFYKLMDDAYTRISGTEWVAYTAAGTIIRIEAADGNFYFSNAK